MHVPSLPWVLRTPQISPFLICSSKYFFENTSYEVPRYVFFFSLLLLLLPTVPHNILLSYIPDRDQFLFFFPTSEFRILSPDAAQSCRWSPTFVGICRFHLQDRNGYGGCRFLRIVLKSVRRTSWWQRRRFTITFTRYMQSITCFDTYV